MTAKNKRGSGRVTPKGTKNPTKSAKPARSGLPESAPGLPPRDATGHVDRGGKQIGKVARPTSHNRGNR